MSKKLTLCGFGQMRERGNDDHKAGACGDGSKVATRTRQQRRARGERWGAQGMSKSVKALAERDPTIRNLPREVLAEASREFPRNREAARLDKK